MTFLGPEPTKGASKGVRTAASRGYHRVLGRQVLVEDKHGKKRFFGTLVGEEGDLLILEDVKIVVGNHVSEVPVVSLHKGRIGNLQEQDGGV